MALNKAYFLCRLLPSDAKLIAAKQLFIPSTFTPSGEFPWLFGRSRIATAE